MKKRTLIIGAGNATRLLLEEIESASKREKRDRNPAASIAPVCILDDNKTGEVHGVPIVGTISQISAVVSEFSVEKIIFAIPSLNDFDRRRDILQACAETNLPVKVLPYIGEFLSSNLISNVRSLNLEDLLGREPIKFDNEDICSFILGKTCMVTGGGGSIGSELVRQIAKYKPKQIIIVDIYENNAYDIQQELKMLYKDSLNLVVLIASVRDYFRMNKIFEKYKPDVVFHAAAHKHVPLMESSPMEAIKNNVIGTLNTATLALYHDVQKFVLISTDKAVNPTNVMGASKRCCEMIIEYLSQEESNTDFVTTRFGNVLGSNGSVIPLFRRYIEADMPVPVTHPDIIRYFMTIPEAVSLVLEASAIAKGGEIFVLDMGQPVKIITLAENLIRMYGKTPYVDVPIEFIGLRPGEKIKEELLMNEEGLKKTKNKLIFIGKQIEVESKKFIKQLEKLKKAAAANDDLKAVMALREIIPTFTTPEEFNERKIETVDVN